MMEHPPLTGLDIKLFSIKYLQVSTIVGIHCSWVVMITNQIERGGLPDFMSGMRIINKTINSGEACRTRACMLQYHWSDWCDGF
jgi:hypothetical protein